MSTYAEEMNESKQVRTSAKQICVLLDSKY